MRSYLFILVALLLFVAPVFALPDRQFCANMTLYLNMNFSKSIAIIPVEVNYSSLAIKPVINSSVIWSSGCGQAGSVVQASEYPLIHNDTHVFYSKFAINPPLGGVTSGVLNFSVYYNATGTFDLTDYSIVDDFSFPPDLNDEGNTGLYFSYIANSWFNDTWANGDTGLYRTTLRNVDINWAEEGASAGVQSAEIYSIAGGGNLVANCTSNFNSSFLFVKRCISDDGFREVLHFYYAFSPYTESRVNIAGDKYQNSHYMYPTGQENTDIFVYFNGTSLRGNETRIYDGENITAFNLNLSRGITGIWTNATVFNSIANTVGMYWLYKTVLNQSTILMLTTDIAGVNSEYIQNGRVDPDGEIIPANTSFWRVAVNESSQSLQQTRAESYFNGLVESPPLAVLSQSFVLPSVTISSPSGTYNTSSADINYTITQGDLAIDSCWYNIDNGTNVTLPACANSTFVFTQDGNFTMNVYVMDIIGNIVSASTGFEVITVIAPVVPSTSTVSAGTLLMLGILLTVIIAGLILFIVVSLSSTELTKEKLVAIFVVVLIAVALIGVIAQIIATM